MQHLAVLGHRRIGFVLGPEQQVSIAHRKRAMTAAMLAIGLPQQPELVFSGDHSVHSGELALASFLALDQPPTAVMCSNDLFASGLMHAAEDRGISMPANLPVIGFDGIELGAYMMPPLTSIVNVAPVTSRRLPSTPCGAACRVLRRRNSTSVPSC